MSLIRIRRNRKKAWIDARKGSPVSRLILLLVIVLTAVWYLGTRF